MNDEISGDGVKSLPTPLLNEAVAQLQALCSRDKDVAGSNRTIFHTYSFSHSFTHSLTHSLTHMFCPSSRRYQGQK